jgi:D-arginine dehydrogenase
VRSADVVIVGAGLAGASAACHLSAAGARCLLLEKEPLAGIHASGRNAAIVRQAVGDATVARLARESRAFLAEPGEGWEGPELLLPTGLLLLDHGDAPPGPRLEAVARAAESCGLPVERVEPARACAAYPWLGDARASGALLSPEDGVADVHALLQGLLRAARRRGSRVETGREVTGFLREGDAVVGVRASGEEISCGAVVLAAGAWCEALGETAGARPFPMRPARRHLFLSEPVGAPAGPVVWHLEPELYLRPEGPGYLLSPCDEDPQPPGVHRTTSDAEALLAEKVLQALPSLKGLRLRRRWVGLRTLTPDGRFVLGPDPEVRGLHWAGGLGGHGVTVSWAVGRVVSDSVLGRPVPDEHSPARPRL